MTRTLDELVATCGPDRLALVHANDSKDHCGSVRDRHENIGAGFIGRGAFAELLAHPATAGVPIIVETPSQGAVGHAADIATLVALRDGRRPRRPRPRAGGSSAGCAAGTHLPADDSRRRNAILATSSPQVPARVARRESRHTMLRRSAH
jgi:hypothetical protein